MTAKPPPIQLIANLVVRGAKGRILLARYDADSDRWWLPGSDLEPYEHPDEAALRVLRDVLPRAKARPVLSKVESFRGRRGWHVMFDYRVDARGAPAPAKHAAWHAAARLPPMAHGRWEVSVVRALSGARVPRP
jgi:ADP-ribose pyrophosphatase YjhB (NUDIX family)